MSSGNQARTRSKRVASLEISPGLISRTTRFLRRSDVLWRLTLCLSAAIAMCLFTKAWSPPLGYRTWDMPSHAIVSRVDFDRTNPDATKLTRDRERKRAETQVVNIYTNDPTALEQLHHDLKDRVFQIIRGESIDKVDETIWQEFLEKVRLPNTDARYLDQFGTEGHAGGRGSFYHPHRGYNPGKLSIDD